MADPKLEQRVVEIMREVTEKRSIKPEDSIYKADMDEVDTMEVMIAIEDEFLCQIPDEFEDEMKKYRQRNHPEDPHGYQLTIRDFVDYLEAEVIHQKKPQPTYPATQAKKQGIISRLFF